MMLHASAVPVVPAVGAAALDALHARTHTHTPPQRVTLTNWAATHSVTPLEYHEPSSVAEVQSLVRAASSSGRVLRVVGSAHSPSDTAFTNDIMLSLKRMDALLVLDMEKQLVKMQAGITLETLNEVLARHGLAVPILGSISEQTIAGCIGTGTHGSGMRVGIIATHVLELQMVLADGEVVITSRKAHPDLFHAALCSFGCLGVITGVVLQAVPAFDVYAVESRDTLPALLRDVPNRALSAPFYRFWWFPHTDHVWEWRGYSVAPKRYREDFPAAMAAITDARSGAEGGSPVVKKLGVMEDLAGSRAWDASVRAWLPAFVATRVLAAWSWFWGYGVGFHLYQALLWLAVFFPIIIPWINALYTRLLFWRAREGCDRSDKMFNFDCLFKQHVNEWAIPVEALPQAMASLKSMLDSSGHKVDWPIEVRFVAGDDIWLSPAYGRPTAYIGIIRYKPYGVEVDYQEYFRRFEEIMVSLQGRPHWAKDFSLRGDAGFQRVYPKWLDFKRLRQEVDPNCVFVNEYVRRTLGLPPPTPRDIADLAAGAQATPAPNASTQ